MDQNHVFLESEGAWRRIFEKVPLQIIEIDLTGRILYLNKSFFDRSVDEFVNTNIYEHFPKKDHAHLKQVYKEVAETSKARRIEISFIMPDWTQKWLASFITPLKHEGKVVRFIVINQDITERKKTDLALRESEEKFRTLAEQSPNMIFINRMGRVVYANKKCEEVMGYSREAFYKPEFGFLSLIAPESRELVHQNFELHTENKQVPPYECTLLTAGGARVETIITTELITFENETAILGIITDITDRRKAEDALRKAHDTLDRRIKTRTAELTQANRQMQLEIEERKKAEEALKSREAMLRSIFDSSPDAITITDAGGIIIDCNQAALDQSAFDSRDEMLHVNSLDRIAPQDRARALANFERTIQHGSVRNIEYLIYKKDGSLFPAELSAASIKDSRGEIVGFVALTKDITDRKAQEEALIKSQSQLREQKKELEQKNIALGEIIARVEVDKKRIKDDIALNVQRVLFPLLDKWDCKDDSTTIVEVLRHHLTELTSPYGTQITEKTAHLTPREVEICNMIKAGLHSRDIAQLLKISTATVERHRKNIRKKLNLTNRDVNLATFLRSPQ